MVCVAVTAATVGSIAGSSLPSSCFMPTTTTTSLAIPFLSKNPNIGLNLTSLASGFGSAQPFLRHCAMKQELETSSSASGFVGANDLLIVGPGVLGRLIAEKWREDNEGSQIAGQTFTTDHHDELIKIGITPSLKGKKASQKYPYVVFCAPLSRSSDYLGDVRYADHELLKFMCNQSLPRIQVRKCCYWEAASNWNGDGSFLFTSSSAPYDCYDNGHCDEDSPVVPIGRSPRTDILLKTEKVVIESGGCVLRLSGLYKADRGAHMYWLKKATVESRPDHIVNLIHYEDAASLVVAILKKKLRSRTFLGCDNNPLSRQEVMDIVQKSGKFSNTFVAFTGTNDPLGKKLNNSKTRKEIGWEPKYPSFSQFLEVSE